MAADCSRDPCRESLCAAQQGPSEEAVAGLAVLARHCPSCSGPLYPQERHVPVHLGVACCVRLHVSNTWLSQNCGLF